MKEEAEKAVTELKTNDQADIIVASIHAGQQNSDPAASADQVIENVAGLMRIFWVMTTFLYQARSSAEWKNCTGRGPKDTGTEVVKIDLSVAKMPISGKCKKVQQRLYQQRMFQQMKQLRQRQRIP